jgi:hypothetical protein
LNRATLEVREAARAYTAEAVETLASIMRHGTTEAARIMAAKELLDRGYGKPAQPREGQGEVLEAAPVKSAIDWSQLSPASRAAMKSVLLEAKMLQERVG